MQFIKNADSLLTGLITHMSPFYTLFYFILFNCVIEFE